MQTQPPLSIHLSDSRHCFVLYYIILLFDDVSLKQRPGVAAAVFCCVLSCGKVYAWLKCPPVSEYLRIMGCSFIV